MRETSFIPVTPRTTNQSEYIRSIQENVLTICSGKAGTGKSLLALSESLRLIFEPRSIYKKLLIIRPYVMNGGAEKNGIGYMPGDFNQKFLPFSESINDNLTLLLSDGDIKKLVESKTIEYGILSTCRGRSIHRTIILVDEGQNIDYSSLITVLTRIGEKTKMILTGDPTQSDLPKGQSALLRIADMLEGIKDLGIVQMNELIDVQRSGIVREILRRIEEKE